VETYWYPAGDVGCPATNSKSMVAVRGNSRNLDQFKLRIIETPLLADIDPLSRVTKRSLVQEQRIHTLSAPRSLPQFKYTSATWSSGLWVAWSFKGPDLGDVTANVRFYPEQHRAAPDHGWAFATGVGGTLWCRYIQPLNGIPTEKKRPPGGGRSGAARRHCVP